MSDTNRTPVLSTHDVRALFRLVGELRELGDDPDAWRAHLVAQLAALCGTRLTTASELSVRDAAPGDASSCGHVVSCVHERVDGLSERDSLRFQRAVLEQPNHEDPAHPALLSLYGTAFTRSRRELVSDDPWYRSIAANELLKPFDCDDYIKSMEPVLLGGRLLLHSITLYRGLRELPFGERERTLVQVLHEQLAVDWQSAHRLPAQLGALSPRLRQTCALLMRGLSEKEVAAELALSTHTVHQYVKELYRRFGVRSRGELHAHLGEKPARAYPRLSSPISGNRGRKQGAVA